MNLKAKYLLKEAEEFLNTKAFDAAHDLSHHQEVWANAQRIKVEAKEKVDLVALQIAAMWHDVVVGRKKLNRNKIKQQTAAYVEKRMQALSFPVNTISKAKTAILQHSEKDIQTIVESKILADADKIEWTSAARFQRLYQEITTGRLKKIKIFAYKKMFKNNFKKLSDKMHFKISQKIFQEKTKLLMKNQEIKKIVTKLGEDLETLLK
jgi:HD superfamily phosphodiesterase